jgi:hypothetical protein
VGKPIELVGGVLPTVTSNAIATATSKSLEAALKVALRTMRRAPRVGSQLLHKALGGAAVNYAFIEHFQEVARGHFTVRRLERVYGKSVVRTEYERLAQGH